MSDDGHDGLTIIGFVGSVFSPYYARARRRGLADPESHVAINVALYGRSARRWAMTERGKSALRRDPSSLCIGPSRMTWDGSGLTIDVDEVCVPVPSRLQGRVRVRPEAIVDRTFAIDGAGHHLWRPIAPRSRVEVRFDMPSIRWSGEGYFDHNTGEEPLEAGFRSWTWARASTADGSLIVYDATTRRTPERAPPLGLSIARDGRVESMPLPARAPLSSTPLWRIGRTSHCDNEHAPAILSTFEDTPFYARSLIETHLAGQRLTAFHESLDLDRFSRGIVQAMLPFRMPRRPHWRT